MDAIFGKPHWVVFNCLTGETTAADQLPFEVGSGEAVDLRLTGAGVAPKHFALCLVKDHGMCLAKRDAAAPIILNGSLVEFSELALNTDYALLAGTELLLIRGGRKINTWSAGLRAAEWHLYDPAAKKREGPFALQDLPGLLRRGPEMEKTVVFPGGASGGFYLKDVAAVLQARQGAMPSAKTASPAAGESGAAGAGSFEPGTWVLVDCESGVATCIDRLPFDIGSAGETDLRVPGLLPRHCAMAPMRGRGVCMVRRDPAANIWLNGLPCEGEELQPGVDYTLQAGTQLFVLRGGEDLRAWQENLNVGEWFIHNPADSSYRGPMTLPEARVVADSGGGSDECIVFPNGMGMGFYLRQLRMDRPAARPVDSPAEERHSVVRTPAPEGSNTCPVCWLRFDLGDLMHVAVHDSLRGDPVLGEDAAQRFHATRFNDRGQALDAFGLPCTEVACPHCRRVLPSSIFDGPQHIFSIVGDQSAGKSYYLSVLAKVLPASLYTHFQVMLHDADPAGNALLNEMKKTLFSAREPREARLAKTQLEGAMYERLPRYGRMAALPKPFIYSMEPLRPGAGRCSVIFYDNAGEHFQPGRDSADSPGAQHVASSSGIFFLFDPFNHPEFRRRLGDHDDPQMGNPIVDQQETILAEMKIRIKKLLNIPAGERIPQPLAVLIGKCDAWMHLLGDEPLKDPLAEPGLDAAALLENSRRVRSLLLEICPTVVGNAETISQRVLYFPVSSFGHPPVRVGPGDFVPDPQRLKPIMVEIPPLWILSVVAPDLLFNAD